MAEDQYLRLLLQLIAGQVGGQKEGSLTDQLNRIGAEGDAISGGPGTNQLNPIPQYAPFQPPTPPTPTPPSFDLLGGRSINTGGPLPPPTPQGTPPQFMGPQAPVPPEPPGPGLSPGGGMHAGGYGGIEGGTWAFPPQAAGAMPPVQTAEPPVDLGPPLEQGQSIQEVPQRPPGYGGAGLDELHVHDPRTPGEQEAYAGRPGSPITGELPSAPEKEGDLSRVRASRELQRLLGMQEMAEGLGNMEVVTTGDILHKTAKGMGTKPRFKAEGLRSLIGVQADRDKTMFEHGLDMPKAKRQEMTYAHGLDLEAIKARGEAATKTGLATRAPTRMSPTERGEWRGAQVAVSELNEILQTKIDKKYNTGPLANAFEDLAAFVGFESFGFAEKQEFKYRAARIVREYIFALSGKQTSGQERKDLMKLVPRGRDDDILFENKIRGFQAFLKKKQNVLLESQPTATLETENLRRMMVEEDQSDPYLHRGGKTVYQVEDPDAPGMFFDVSESTWKAIMANPGGTRYKAVPLKKP